MIHIGCTLMQKTSTFLHPGRMKATLHSFRVEIGAVLIVKIILIFSLKLLFFNDPADRNLSGQEVDQRWFGAGPAPSVSFPTPEDSCHANRADC
jgi:hypothetical protein